MRARAPQLFSRYGELRAGASRALEELSGPARGVVATSLLYADIEAAVRWAIVAADCREQLAQPTTGENLWTRRAKSEGAATTIFLVTVGAVVAGHFRAAGAVVIGLALVHAAWRFVGLHRFEAQHKADHAVALERRQREAAEQLAQLEDASLARARDG